MNGLWKFNRLLLLAFLICMGTVAHAQDDTSKGDYSKIIDVLKSDPNQPLCVVPIASLDGQVWRASGTNGGLSSKPPSNGSVTPYDYGSQKLNGLINGSNPVAILVVDSFQSGVSSADTYNTIAADMAGGASPWAELDNNRFSHGDLVFGHIVGLLQGAGLSPDPSSDYSIWTQNGSPLVYVVKVPAVNYSVGGAQISPDSVANTILGVIHDIHASTLVTQFVVNESFAVIPCIVTSNNDSSLSFQDYIQGIVSQSQGGLGFADVTGLNDPLNNRNPLHDFTQTGQNYCSSLPPEIQATFVASSGNSGLDFPFVPAGWDEVVGVTDSVSHFPNGYANAIVSGSSDVDFVPGGWFQFTVPEPGNAPPIELIDLYYRGTSFSAPTYAVQVALESTAGGSKYAINPCLGPNSSK